LLALLGAHHFLHVSRIRVKLLTLRRLMSYIYMEHPFLMFQHLSMLCLYENTRISNFFVDTIFLAEGVFVTQLSVRAEISVIRTVWVRTDCCFVSDMFHLV
jgi:hypothetical protein